MKMNVQIPTAIVRSRWLNNWVAVASNNKAPGRNRIVSCTARENECAWRRKARTITSIATTGKNGANGFGLANDNFRMVERSIIMLKISVAILERTALRMRTWRMRFLTALRGRGEIFDSVADWKEIVRPSSRDTTSAFNGCQDVKKM